MSSILTTVKKALGIADDAFDPEIILHINTVLNNLNQIGIGPLQGYQIEDDAATWDSFLGGSPLLNNVKSYIALKVQLIFDPPVTSFAIQARKEIVEELEQRILIAKEVEKWEQTSMTILDL